MDMLTKTAIRIALPDSDTFEDGQIPETYEQRMMTYLPVKTYKEYERAALIELARVCEEIARTEESKGA